MFQNNTLMFSQKPPPTINNKVHVKYKAEVRKETSLYFNIKNIK